MIATIVWILAISPCVLLKAPQPIMWYDFLECGNVSNLYHDLYQRGHSAWGGSQTSEGVRFSPSKPWRTEEDCQFTIDIPIISGQSFYFAFSTEPFDGAIIKLTGITAQSSSEESLASVYYHLDGTIELCVNNDLTCYRRQLVDDIHSGMLFTVEKGENSIPIYTLSISNVYARMAGKALAQDSGGSLWFPIGDRYCLAYILGVFDGVLSDLDYTSLLYHTGPYGPINCTTCRYEYALACLVLGSPAPILTQLRSYHCPCIWPLKYQEQGWRCQLPTVLNCDPKCELFCNHKGDRCLSCKSPYESVQLDGDFMTCGCATNTAFQESTQYCRHITPTDCAPGCMAKCDSENGKRCAFACRRGYKAKEKDGDFVTCNCPEGMGYEESTQSCIELSKDCHNGCADLCDKRNSSRCFKGCKNNLIFLDKDGDMGSCSCQYPKAYRESTVMCENVVNDCKRGCSQCVEDNPLLCYDDCKPTFRIAQKDGDFHYCNCTNGKLYQDTQDKCVYVKDFDCYYSCENSCCESQESLCAYYCLDTYKPKLYDGDFFSCACPPHTAERSQIHACEALTEKDCAPGCAGECSVHNRSMCAFACKANYESQDADGELVKCICPENAEINEETKDCVIITFYTRNTLAILLPILGLLALVGILCRCCNPKAVDRQAARIRHHVGLLRLKIPYSIQYNEQQQIEAERQRVIDEKQAIQNRREELKEELGKLSPEGQMTPAAGEILKQDQQLYYEQTKLCDMKANYDKQIAERKVITDKLAQDIREREERLNATVAEGGLNPQSFLEQLGKCPLCNQNTPVMANDCGHVPSICLSSMLSITYAEIEIRNRNIKPNAFTVH